MTHEINYPLLIDAAMRSVVRDTLTQVAKHGIPGEHHFFISFKTNFPGVKMSDSLRTRYPEGVTIVLQHQFWDLKVEDTQFAVTVSFSNVPEKLLIPYAAITAFADPSVKFGLQFHDESDEDEMELDLAAAPEGPSGSKQSVSFEDEDIREEEEIRGSAEIITLDAFRKKR